MSNLKNNFGKWASDYHKKITDRPQKNKLMEKQIEFTWADIWLLQSIAVASQNNPASLKDVIAVGDAINHAIFTFTELQCGLAKLSSAEYIEYDNNEKSFALDKTFLSEYTRITQRYKSSRKKRDILEAHFHAISWTAKYDPNKSNPEWLFPFITHEGYEKSIKAYKSSFWKEYNNLPKNGG